jgi:drug/metabolite transporter (DMT)-like permease
MPSPWSAAEPRRRQPPRSHPVAAHHGASLWMHCRFRKGLPPGPVGDRTVHRMATAAPSQASTGRLVLAFSLLYVIWGSTYLAIAIAGTGGPPLALAAIRMLAAGAILHAICRLRGQPALTPRQWLAASVVGGLLMVLGNGLLWLAEQRVPSGETALMIAMTPLWMTLLSWCMGLNDRPRWPVWAGMVLGLVGVGWLSGLSHLGSHVEPQRLRDVLLILAASLCWSVGSVLSRVMPAPSSPLMASAAQTWAGGVQLLAVSLILGNWHAHMFKTMTWPAASALLYLIIAGSMLGYASYMYLLRHVSTSLASTYAFVNPIIAVLLGWLILGEPLGMRALGAGSLIIIAVTLIVIGNAASSRGRAAPSARTSTAALARSRTGRS